MQASDLIDFTLSGTLSERFLSPMDERHRSEVWTMNDFEEAVTRVRVVWCDRDWLPLTSARHLGGSFV